MFKFQWFNEILIILKISKKIKNFDKSLVTFVRM